MPRRTRKNAHQDTMTDPFEGSGNIWDALDEIAEDFTWATAAPQGSASHHARQRGRRG